eukprot:4112176-Pyramimonas_sp.AAC.1
MAPRAEHFGLSLAVIRAASLGQEIEVARFRYCLGAMLQDNSSVAPELHLRRTSTDGAIEPLRKAAAPRAAHELSKKLFFPSIFR